MPSAEPSLIRKHLREWDPMGIPRSTVWCSVAHDGVPSVHRAKAGGLPGLCVTPEQRGTQVIVYIQTISHT